MSLGFNDALLSLALLKGYVAANTDTPGTTNYYGFTRTDGAYYILKEAIAGNVATYTYYKSDSGVYATDWTNRASLTYGRYDTIFK